MSSARITCPDCKSVLRPTKPVPDGKQVKCPKCGNPFLAPGLVEDEEERPRKKKKPGKKATAAIKKAPATQPPPQKSVDDDDDEGGGIYSFAGANEKKEEEERPDIEYAPDMSIKDLRGPAQEAVVRPSNLMLLIGGVSCLCNIFLICYCFWPMVFSDSPLSEDEWKKVLKLHYTDEKNAAGRIDPIKERKDLKDKDEEIVREAEEKEVTRRFAMMGGFIALLIYNAIAIIGAVKMQNLESRGWGIASSIMTLLPMGPAGIGFLIFGVFYYTIGDWILDERAPGAVPSYSIGLGVIPCLFALFVGISSLRTLSSQEVKDGFEYIAE